MNPSLRRLSGTVYGHPVHGHLPPSFAPYLWPGEEGGGDPLELTWRRVDRLPPMDPVWESDRTEEPTAGGPFRLGRLPGGFELGVEGDDRGRFRCTPRRIGVRWTTTGTAAAHHLFSYVLPLWLESRGVPVLHGSAVTVGNRAVGFLGPSGMGKSVLCAALVHRGCGFLADDGLALERAPDGTWRCPPGPPLLRLWPSGLTGPLGIRADPLPRVWARGDKRRLDLGRVPSGKGRTAEGRGVAGPVPPLRRLYLLRRRPDPDGPVTLSPSAPGEALVRLLEHGVAAAPAAALGLAEGRFQVLADAAAAVPVRHLAFPGGGDPGRVLAAIEEDLEAGGPPPSTARRH